MYLFLFNMAKLKFCISEFLNNYGQANQYLNWNIK